MLAGVGGARFAAAAIVMPCVAVVTDWRAGAVCLLGAGWRMLACWRPSMLPSDLATSSEGFHPGFVRSRSVLCY